MNHPRYQLVEIVDDGLPVYIAMQRIGEPFLELAWQNRHAIDNRLCNWLCTLDTPPKCRVILGKGVQLTWAAARTLMQYQRQRVATMAGSDGPPDFALWPAVNRGGYYRRYRRPCLRVKGDVVEAYRSIEEAARRLQTSMDDVSERIESGHRDGQGWAWFDGVPKKP